MKQLAPVQTSFQAVDSAATTVLGAIEQHQQTAMAYEAQTGEAAGSGLRPGTLWAQALGGTAQRDSNTEAAGYNSTDFGLAAGLDHLFTPNLLGGVAVSWLRAWTQGIDSASGQPGAMAANEAIETPTTHVLTCRNTSYPKRFTSGTTQRLASMPAMAIGNSSNPECNGE